jgi:hypothetical protein
MRVMDETEVAAVYKLEARHLRHSSFSDVISPDHHFEPGRKVCGLRFNRQSHQPSFLEYLRGGFEKLVAGGPLIAARTLHHENGNHSGFWVDR